MFPSCLCCDIRLSGLETSCNKVEAKENMESNNNLCQIFINHLVNSKVSYEQPFVKFASLPNSLCSLFQAVAVPFVNSGSEGWGASCISTHYFIVTIVF